MASRAVQVFTFRLQVSDGWTQTEVELVLSNNFEVLSFVGSEVEVRCR